MQNNQSYALLGIKTQYKSLIACSRYLHRLLSVSSSDLKLRQFSLNFSASSWFLFKNQQSFINSKSSLNGIKCLYGTASFDNEELEKFEH